MRLPRLAPLLAAAALLVVTGCSAATGDATIVPGSTKLGDSDLNTGKPVGTPQNPVTDVKVYSIGTAFSVSRMYVPVGKPVTIVYSNRDSGVPHNFHILDPINKETQVAAGPVVQTLTVTFDQPGTYRFVCDVHPQEMFGVIDVVG